MEFERHEAKRRQVLGERGIDILDARLLFDGRPVLTAPSRRPDEERWLTIGGIEGRLVAVVWTWRGDRVRIITMRRASDEEKTRYRAAFGG